MSKRKKNKNKEKENKKSYFLNFGDFELHPETKKGVWAIILIGGAIILFLASFNSAGPAGSFVYNVFNKLFGWGYYLLPLILLVIAGVFLTSERQRLYKITFLGAIIFVFSGLGLIDIISPRAGGLTGKIIGSIEALFGYAASIIAIGVVAIASLLVTLNLPIKIRKKENMEEEEEIEVAGISIAEQEGLNKEEGEAKEEIEEEPIKEKIISAIGFGLKPKGAIRQQIKNYIFPPVDLLKSSIEKPTVGDLRASANIIKRTLESFGIPVEMGEINIGPKVTRYTLKPAEGIKLSRIIADRK